MKIIGIAGTNGSGKDTVGRLLEKRHGFLFVSVTDILRDELDKENKPPSRENMRGLGDRWRRELGLAVLIEKALQIYKSTSKDSKGVVVASVRNLGEVEYIHNSGGVLVWVDAEPQIRYQRVTRRRRNDEDSKSYEEFIQEEQDEMHVYGDEATLAMSEVKKLCDVFIENNSDDTDILASSVEHALREYL